MTNVSDTGRIMTTQYILKALRGDLDATQREISTGKKSQNIGGLGALGAAEAISFRNKFDVLDVYSENLKRASVKFSLMDKAMGDAAVAARDTLTNLREQLQSGMPKAGIIADEARTQLQAVTSRLNAQVDGHYLFSGDDVNNPPFASAATLHAGMGALAASWVTGGTTPAAAVAAARGVGGTALGYSASGIAAGNVSFRADDATDIDFTTKAAQPGFADVLRGLAIVANLPAPTTDAEKANYWNVINGAITLLDEGTKKIDEYQGVLGNKANQVDALLDQHEANQVTFKSFIGEVEDADMAAAAARLQNLQTQLQASYSMIGQLKDLSLVNFI